MFKWFKKKKKTKSETDEKIPVISEEDILNNIYVIKRRCTIDRRYITFLNARVTKKTCRKLKRKGIIVEVFESEENPSFKVSWN